MKDIILIRKNVVQLIIVKDTAITFTYLALGGFLFSCHIVFSHFYCSLNTVVFGGQVR